MTSIPFFFRKIYSPLIVLLLLSDGNKFTPVVVLEGLSQSLKVGVGREGVGHDNEFSDPVGTLGSDMAKILDHHGDLLLSNVGEREVQPFQVQPIQG